MTAKQHTWPTGWNYRPTHHVAWQEELETGKIIKFPGSRDNNKHRGFDVTLYESAGSNNVLDT